MLIGTDELLTESCRKVDCIPPRLFDSVGVARMFVVVLWIFAGRVGTCGAYRALASAGLSLVAPFQR